MRKPDNSKKPVAKSLHTVSVIYQVASLSLPGDVERSVDRAMQILELAGRPDPYGLRARALALLIADQPKEA